MAHSETGPENREQAALTNAEPTRENPTAPAPDQADSPGAKPIPDADAAARSDETSPASGNVSSAAAAASSPDSINPPDAESEAHAKGLMDASLEREVADAMAGMSGDDLADLGTTAQESFGPDQGAQLGRIEAVRGDDVFIRLGGKSQGVLTRDQFKSGETIAVGEPVEVFVDRYDRESDLLILTRKGQPRTAQWHLLKPGDVVEGRVIGLNRGGLEVQLKGIKAFMPASHVDTIHVKDISILLNEHVRCEVIEIDRKGRRLTVSRRRILEREAAAMREQLLTELAVDQVRKGLVGNLTEFGAFVDIGGVDGLIHISDLAWEQIKHPSEVVKTGDVVEVKVLKIKDEPDGKKRISLGLKQLQANPWNLVEKKYPVGSTHRVRVVRLADFGAFAELESGIDGLIPVSEMSWSRIGKPAEVVSTGQTVDVAILRVEPKRRRIAMSMKQAAPDPWAEVMEGYKPDTKVNGKITKLMDFGAFVELAPGVEGLVHISELANRRVRSCGEVVSVGQEVEARILKVDPAQRRISLSLREPQQEASIERAPEPGKQKPRKKSRQLRGGLASEWDWAGLGLDNLPSSRRS